MQLEYETKRLSLRVCNYEQAEQVLRFLERNRTIFEPWEPLHSPYFYTTDYQTRTLDAEFKLTLQTRHVRYYLFLKDNPNEIIGTVCFSNIHHADDKSCRLGYKIAAAHQRNGYAKEALTCLIPMLHEEFGLHRIEADIMPTNEPSLRLVESLGFCYEGIARSSHEICGSWKDHARYALILS